MIKVYFIFDWIVVIVIMRLLEPVDLMINWWNEFVVFLFLSFLSIIFDIQVLSLIRGIFRDV